MATVKEFFVKVCYFYKFFLFVSSIASSVFYVFIFLHCSKDFLKWIIVRIGLVWSCSILRLLSEVQFASDPLLSYFKS